jgi:hypothetical protein
MKDLNLDKQTQIESGFKIPDGYFDSFSEKVMTQISSENLKEDTKVVSLFDRNKKWMLSIAASFVVLFSASYYFYNSNKEQLEITEMEHYIVTNSTITDDDIASLLNENDIQKLCVDYSLEHNSTENIDIETLNLEENL